MILHKIVDNFDLIGPNLDWPNDDVFYFCQIIVRRKDFISVGLPYDGPDNKVLKDYYFESREKFDYKREEIAGFCAYFNARAYIHLNKRSKKDVAFECLKIMADRMSKGEYKSLRSVYATACGQRVSDPNKKWIVDIDFNDKKLEDNIVDFINGECDPIENKFICEIPTPNGRHLIFKPFNSQKFNNKFGLKNTNILQRNNPTVLYCNLRQS